MGFIRLALALVVVLAHAGAAYIPMHAGLAVQCFFIISGFYMALILSGKYEAATGLFYTNRLFRLFPSYLVVLAGAAIALLVFNINAYVDRETFLAHVTQGPAGWAIIASNVLLVGQDILCWFDVAPDGASLVADTSFQHSGLQPAWKLQLIPQAWSISMELMFYAIAPFLVRLRWWIIALIALVSIGVRAIGAELDVSYSLWPRRLFPAELFLFLLGMLGHRALGWVERAPRLVGWIFAAAILVLIGVHSMLPLNAESGRWLMFAVVGVGVPFAFHAFRSVRFDKWIGELSYPVYICHILVIALAFHFAPQQQLLVIIAGVLGLSIALLLLIERPLDAWRQKRVRAKTPPGSPLAAAPAV